MARNDERPGAVRYRLEGDIDLERAPAAGREVRTLVDLSIESKIVILDAKPTAYF